MIEYDHPSSPPQNHHLPTTQVLNCHGDTEIQEDIENGWHRITHDVKHKKRRMMTLLETMRRGRKKTKVEDYPEISGSDKISPRRGQSAKKANESKKGNGLWYRN